MIKPPWLLALALLGSSGSREGRLQLEVERGRVVLEAPPVPGRELVPRTVLAGQAPCDVTGGSHLIAPALSDFDLRWLGCASARVRGSADLVVESGLGLRLGGFTAAEVEVRRGALRVEVEGLASFEAASVALGLRTTSDGGVELLHRGGQPLEVTALDEGPTWRVKAGERLRIPRPPARP